MAAISRCVSLNCVDGEAVGRPADASKGTKVSRACAAKRPGVRRTNARVSDAARRARQCARRGRKSNGWEGSFPRERTLRESQFRMSLMSGARISKMCDTPRRTEIRSRVRAPNDSRKTRRTRHRTRRSQYERVLCEDREQSMLTRKVRMGPITARTGEILNGVRSRASTRAHLLARARPSTRSPSRPSRPRATSPRSPARAFARPAPSHSEENKSERRGDDLRRV